MIEEIAGGLKNAIERGSTLEQAVQSFITAGYNPVEVRQAAQSLSYMPSTLKPVETPRNEASGNQQKPKELPVMPSVNVPQRPVQPQSNMQLQSNFQQPAQQMPSPQLQQQIPFSQPPMQRREEYSFNRSRPKSGNSVLIVILVFILLLLVGGLTYMIFFGKDLLDSILS
ncbi:MAG: hypothetical protein Q7S27_06425 [Nanoarchaeota archaeon]|nr:hypothetical protein [Nanoarchaeota archaeon]